MTFESEPGYDSLMVEQQTRAHRLIEYLIQNNRIKAISVSGGKLLDATDKTLWENRLSQLEQRSHQDQYPLLLKEYWALIKTFLYTRNLNQLLIGHQLLRLSSFLDFDKSQANFIRHSLTNTSAYFVLADNLQDHTVVEINHHFAEKSVAQHLYQYIRNANLGKDDPSFQGNAMFVHLPQVPSLTDIELLNDEQIRQELIRHLVQPNMVVGATLRGSAWIFQKFGPSQLFQVVNTTNLNQPLPPLEVKQVFDRLEHFFLP